MKKLMIAAFAVAVAAVAQAASISWNATAYNYITKAGVVQTAATALEGDFVLAYLGTGTADWNNATVANVGTVSYGTVKGVANAKASGSYAWTYGAEGTPSNGDIFGVMFKDDKGDLYQLEYADGSKVTETVTISGMGNNTWATAFTFATGNYTAVPEPTSGLLLLLGMAGLALRRKQK